MLNLDTHILIHSLIGEVKQKEQKLLSENEWCISSIVLWEITKLSQLKRIDISIEDDNFKRAIRQIQVIEISIDICLSMRKLDFHSDPADEIIAATSLAKGIPLLTRDKRILKSKIVPLALK